eukprot:jgi/Psemu1/25655/gm1.25655_g
MLHGNLHNSWKHALCPPTNKTSEESYKIVTLAPSGYAFSTAGNVYVHYLTGGRMVGAGKCMDFVSSTSTFYKLSGKGMSVSQRKLREVVIPFDSIARKTVVNNVYNWDIKCMKKHHCVHVFNAGKEMKKEEQGNAGRGSSYPTSVDDNAAEGEADGNAGRNEDENDEILHEREGLRLILNAFYKVTQENVTSAPMSAYLTRNHTRFEFSDVFSNLVLRNFETESINDG